MYLRTLKILSVLLFVFGSFLTEAKASHIMGVDITYECVTGCIIRVHWSGYGDCDGITFGLPAIGFDNPPGCPTDPTPIGNWSPFVQVPNNNGVMDYPEVTPVCPTIQTTCENPASPISGVRLFSTFRDYNICNATPNCIFTITWTSCCRNPDITSLQNAASQGMYVGSTTINTGLGTCNSSPQFNNLPTPYICAGQPFTFNQGAVDPEGDSLVYSLGPCYDGPGAPVPYNPGFSANAPMGPSWAVSINPFTGDVTVIPNPNGAVQVGVICVYVEEYRNGVLINTIVRDIQMNVIPCPNNQLPTALVTNVVGGTQTGPFAVTVCAGTQLSFDIPSNDPNAADILTMFWNQAFPTATFAQTGFPGVQDTIVGTNPSATFSWTPPSQGVFSFVITIKDDACPILGTNQFSITITVNGGLIGSNAAVQTTGCSDVIFTANPGAGGTGPYTYQWFGNGNLNINPGINLQTFPHIYPGPGIYNYQVLITDAYGCEGLIDSTITIINGPTADAGPDISLCSSYNIPIGQAGMPGTTYNWTPATGLNNANIANPTVNIVNPGPGPMTYNYTLTADDGLCQAVDFVTLVVYPIPTASINPSNVSACNGDVNVLTASGGTSYLWSTGETTPSITVSPNTTTTYSVTVTNNGCASLPATATIDVTPGPVAFIAGTPGVCPGQDVTLTAVGGNNWLWSNGEVTQTILLNNLQQDTTMTVIAANGACTGLPVSFDITLFDEPVAAFSSPTVCDEALMAFTNGSTIPSGTIVGYDWNFGDPTAGTDNYTTLADPGHTFTGSGVYNVTLTVTSDNGCTDFVTQQVNVNALPIANFDFQDVCMGEQMVFDDQTPGAITNWQWTFGDGSTGTIPDPSHNYTGPNGYNVNLIVTDANGCQDDVTKTVFVHPNPVADFNYVFKCFNTVTEFTQAATLSDPFGTELALWTWNFTDPNGNPLNTTNELNPTFTYDAQGGYYYADLEVTTTKGCKDSHREVINPDVPDNIERVETFVCAGFPATITVSSPDPTTTVLWFYDNTSPDYFHTGNSYTVPPFNYTQVFYVAMQDAEGCVYRRVPVYAKNFPGLTVDLNIGDNTLEIPNAITEFTADAIANNLGNVLVDDSVSLWQWDFGDGTVSDLENPVHEYTEPGLYDVSFHFVDPWGCERSYNVGTVNVESNVNLFVPNAFTPNGDGLNDLFQVSHQLITEFNIIIFDRWGKLIFENNNPNFTWDGRDKKGAKMGEGVYTYRIIATDYRGAKRSSSGSIMLMY